MDDRRFDGLTKAFASGNSRRALLKGLLGIGSAVVPVASHTGVEAARRPKPTPKPVSCPGQQIWNGSQCACPSGLFGCGPDCCGTPEQCCDNACCPNDSICFSEEICCPRSQVCGGACCAPGLDCCFTGDPVCIDRASGDCCDDSECASLTDSCNTGLCDPSTNHCVAQPLADGVNCGNCAICQSGSCVTCEHPFECCSDSVCVDAANGGCCADTDCPASTDPCIAYACQTHQCVEVDAIVCPVGQECFEGNCVCVGGNRPCGDGETAVCCATGETCQTITFPGGSISLCCPDGTPACIDPENGTAVCCGGNANCQEISSGAFGTIAVCCEGEPCVSPQGVSCCPLGQVCSQLVIGTTTVGTCCDQGHAACFDGAGLYCCDAGETCQSIEFQNQTVSTCCAGEACTTEKGIVCCSAGESCKTLYAGPGFSIGACCAEGIDACVTIEGMPVCCGDDGYTCQPVTISEGITVDVCCDGPPCAGLNGIVCCGAGESCKIVDAGPGFSIGACCAEGIDACLTGEGMPVCCGDDGYTCQPVTILEGITVDVCCDGPPCAGQTEIVCCGAGESCKIVDAGPGLSIGACCAEGIDACLTVEGKPVCCGDDGYTCQPITVSGGITVDVCCDGPPCFGQNGVVCCASDQICDTTLGCQPQD